MSKRLKYILAGIAALFVLLLVVPFLIPTSAWLGPVQEKAGAALGTKVTVGGLRLAFLPLPHLTASKIDVGDGAISVGSVTIYPELTTLFSATRKIRSVNADKLVVSKKGMDLLAGLAAGPQNTANPKNGGAGTPPPDTPAASAPPVEIGKLRLRDAEIELASGKLPPIDLDAEMDGLNLVHAEVSVDGGKAKLKIEPKDGGWEIALEASNWRHVLSVPR